MIKIEKRNLMSKKHKVDLEENIEALKSSLDTAEGFIEKHRVKLLIGVGAVVLIILAVYGTKKLYIEPRNEHAQEAMYQAVNAFEAGNFDLALKGNGNVMGLLDVIDEYGSTPAGNLAELYVGLSYLHQGKYQDAVKYIEKFDTNEEILKSVADGALGDAYVELNKLDKAIDLYEDAADAEIAFTAPRYLNKAAVVYESQKKWDKAIKVYEEIKSKYPTSSEARDADKNIERAELLQKN